MTEDPLSSRLKALELAVSELAEQNAELRAQVKYLRDLRTTFTPPKHLEMGKDVRIAVPAIFSIPTEKHRIVIGDRTRILRGADWHGPITVGSGCYFNLGSYVRAFVTIEDDVLCGPYVRFLTDLHEIGPSAKRGGPVYRRPIHVGKGSWIGGGVTIVGGVTVGKGAVVAAGAVVVKDVPDNVVVAGVPAKVVKELAP